MVTASTKTYRVIPHSSGNQARKHLQELRPARGPIRLGEVLEQHSGSAGSWCHMVPLITERPRRTSKLRKRKQNPGCTWRGEPCENWPTDSKGSAEEPTNLEESKPEVMEGCAATTASEESRAMQAKKELRMEDGVDRGAGKNADGEHLHAQQTLKHPRCPAMATPGGCGHVEVRCITACGESTILYFLLAQSFMLQFLL